jgi:hypothetical protein
VSSSSTAGVAVASKTRAALTNNPVRAGRHGQSAEGRRVRDLFGSYLSALGNPADAATQALILAASELVVGAEKARADLLAGRGDVDQVVRLENLSARALRRLGLGKPAAKPRIPFAERLLADEGPALRATEARSAAGQSAAITAFDRNERTGTDGAQAGGAVR